MAENNKVKKGYVLLFKATKYEDIKDPYVEELEDNGFVAECASALGFRYINQDQMWDVLQYPDNHMALVLTSQRAVEAIQKVLQLDAHKEEQGKVIAGWRKLPTFVVGSATAEAAAGLGLNTVGEDCGNSEKLVALIIKELKEVEEKKSVFFPCANIRKETIPVQLEAEGIPLTSVVAYETEASAGISGNLEVLSKAKGYPEYIVYFSPSGIQFTIDELKQLQYPIEAIKFIALGPSTKRRIVQAGLEVAGAAVNPTLSSFMKTILSVVDSSKEGN